MRWVDNVHMPCVQEQLWIIVFSIVLMITYQTNTSKTLIMWFVVKHYAVSSDGLDMFAAVHDCVSNFRLDHVREWTFNYCFRNPSTIRYHFPIPIICAVIWIEPFRTFYMNQIRIKLQKWICIRCIFPIK